MFTNYRNLCQSSLLMLSSPTKKMMWFIWQNEISACKIEWVETTAIDERTRMWITYDMNYEREGWVALGAWYIMHVCAYIHVVCVSIYYKHIGIKWIMPNHFVGLLNAVFFWMDTLSRLQPGKVPKWHSELLRMIICPITMIICPLHVINPSYVYMN